MKRCVTTIAFFILTFFVSSWGFQPHKLINLNAIFTLPPNLAIFYKKHSFQIREFAVNADKRVYIDPNESPRHFIDLDKIENTDSLLIPWYKVREKFNEKIILSKGIVPWQIDNSYRQLVKAFYNKDMTRIIKLSADLGHYAADAHVPLHTTSNYNGQFTNQVGIHALWETRIPEMFHHKYKLMVGPAKYINNVLDFAWSTVLESHHLLDSVLTIEKQLSKSLPKVLQRAYIQRGQQIQPNYSDFYVISYHLALNGMVQRRMKKSIHAIGSLWYSAWVDAGQPDLSKLEKKSIENDSIDLTINKIPKGRQEWH